MKITRLIMTTAVLLLPALSAWAGDLSVDNLTVSKDASVNGTLSIQNGVTATGGTITTNGNYLMHTFTDNGTFAVTGGSLTCEVLVVGGGGGSGGGQSAVCYAAGGGGGEVKTTNCSLSGSVSVTIGTGGIGYNFNVNGGSGGASSINLTSAAGGGGGLYSGPGTGGTSGNGHTGGARNAYGGGGGGGNSANGSNAGGSYLGGAGGDGTASSISGTSTYYGGGGGGTSAGTGGADGLGGGEANYGGGGNYSQTGGHGGSGIVIVRYSPTTSSSSNVTTLTVSSNGINQASASGNNVFMGKVGIGTNNPAEKLHVAGNVQIDGSLKIGGETRTNWPTAAMGALMAASNLSDVANAGTARSNLGLGSAATNDAGAFLTPTGNGSQLTGITAAQVGALSTNSGALLAANNLSELTASAGTARSNLGLGSAAINDAGAFLTPTGNGSQLTGITAAQVGALSTNAGALIAANNLSELTASAGTARSNLGLGSAAINDAGAFLSTNGGVVNGDISLVSPAGDIPMGVYTNQ